MEAQQNQKVVILRNPSKKFVSANYAAFRNKIDQRRKNVSKYYPIIEKILFSSPYIKKFGDLVKMACYIAQKEKLHVDRDSKRGKEAIICWYCENWNKVCPLLSESLKEVILPKYQLFEIPSESIVPNEFSFIMDPLLDFSAESMPDLVDNSFLTLGIDQ
ncbi:hypothetical protein TVAG_219510 [Trichomonas vaginalis G3]|uniref:Uncharacterized protein n=1 Tax=Trichomonas vaginalis (strain ATCC PRA-98 / G3) TaxID=412133 RepID=A2DXR0_TRIV3|nr:hypothetical protein TVAGG3_0683060 [Trichomonas vaginalis G3]EAY14770.1 hypothetical protein TVAG_219510 [Trichomonas vaginalis G3]KAI5508043.1 hypothetical protein TVAGG3_0683060 [Trichomonas vaginalis G3]|eukprot:XP_001326993.1 hypothetical protein [Trichomonas vaginalis G3]